MTEISSWSADVACGMCQTGEGRKRQRYQLEGFKLGEGDFMEQTATEQGLVKRLVRGVRGCDQCDAILDAEGVDEACIECWFAAQPVAKVNFSVL